MKIMTDQEYFAQRLSPADFERHGFENYKTELPMLYFRKSVGTPAHLSFWICIMYDVRSGYFVMDARNLAMEEPDSIHSGMLLFTQEELDFIINRTIRTMMHTARFRAIRSTF